MVKQRILHINMVECIKVTKMRKKILILLLLTPFIYVNTDYFIKKHVWKNVSKHQIESRMIFNGKDLKLSFHQIYFLPENEKAGVVLLSFYKILIVLNSKNEICYYLNYD